VNPFQYQDLGDCSIPDQYQTCDKTFDELPDAHVHSVPPNRLLDQSGAENSTEPMIYFIGIQSASQFTPKRFGFQYDEKNII